MFRCLIVLESAPCMEYDTRKHDNFNQLDLSIELTIEIIRKIKPSERGAKSSFCLNF